MDGFVSGKDEYLLEWATLILVTVYDLFLSIRKYV